MITNDWSYYRDWHTWRIVKPGSTGRDAGVQDVGGFYVGKGCKARITLALLARPGWYKVRDGQYIQGTDIRCWQARPRRSASCVAVGPRSTLAGPVELHKTGCSSEVVR